MTNETGKSQTSVTLGLAFTAGIGFITMAAALAVGVIQGTTADNNAVGMLFAAGVALFILGFAGWLAVAQPHKHFDDINVPLYTGYHDDEHAEHEPADKPA